MSTHLEHRIRIEFRLVRVTSMVESEGTSLSLALQNARIAAGLTQHAAAEGANIGIVSLSRYERGLRVPPLDILLRLANVYGVGAEQLLQLAEFSTATLPTLDIPIRGYVSAGNPRDAWEVELGTVPIPDFILREHPNCFALIISGNSLDGDNIGDGDIVVVDPEAAYQVDKIYIVRLDDGEITAKHLFIDSEGQITLRASNHDYEELKVTGQVQGRVVWHMRRM